MAYVITELCAGRKDGACAAVCPVAAIHPTKDEPGHAEAAQLYIDPETCIDCGVCEPECPVSAIFEEEYVPEERKASIRINAAWYKSGRR